jgi:hypothetical protein
MVLVSLLLCLLFSVQGAGTDKMITIDGSKEPHKIPEWAAWESTFDALSLTKRKDLKAFDESLKMEAADKELVYAAALEQTRRRARLVKRVKALETQVTTGESFLELHRKSWDMNFEYRQEILDSSERLLNQLSPDGRVAILAWVANARKGIKVTMPESNLAFFRRPR